MKDSKSPDSHDEIPDKNFNKELLETKKNKDLELISSTNNELDQKDDSKINQSENIIHEGNNIIKDKILKDNKNDELDSKFKDNIDKKNNIDTNNNKIIKNTSAENNNVTVQKANAETTSNTTAEDNKVTVPKANADTVSKKSLENIDKGNNEIIKDKTLEENKKVILKDKSSVNSDLNSPKKISTTNPVKAKTKPVKEPPIEKKPFLEFVNDYLIPEIKNEFKQKGKEVNKDRKSVV